MAIERLLSGSIQERIEELLRPEDLIMEAARDDEKSVASSTR